MLLLYKKIAKTQGSRLLKSDSSGFLPTLCHGRSIHEESNTDEKLVKVAVIGDPNSGKSTLINYILGRRINSVSSKCHTTRRKSHAVLNVNNTQLVFVDTPGFVSHRSRISRTLEKSLIFDAYESVGEVDVVVALHDASNFYSKYHFSKEVSTALGRIPQDVCGVLALNKVDLVKEKTELLSIARKLCKPPSNQPRKRKSLQQMFDVHDGTVRKGGQEENFQYPFQQVFMLSAMFGRGVASLTEFLLSKAVTSPWLYDSGFVTDQSLDEMIMLCVREKVLDMLSAEIPYVVLPKVDLVNEDEQGITNVLVSIDCDSKRVISALMGTRGSTIRNIAVSAEQSLSEALGKPVFLKIILKQSRKRASSS